MSEEAWQELSDSFQEAGVPVRGMMGSRLCYLGNLLKAVAEKGYEIRGGLCDAQLEPLESLVQTSLLQKSQINGDFRSSDGNYAASNVCAILYQPTKQGVELAAKLK